MFRRVAINLLTIFMVGLLVILAISFSIKDVFTNALSNSMINNLEVLKILEITKTVIPEITDNEYNQIKEDIINSDKTKEITEKYMEVALDLVNNKGNNTNIDIESSINDFIDDSIFKIQSKFKVEIPKEYKEIIYSNFKSTVNGESTYVNISNKIENNLTGRQKAMLKLYSTLTELRTRIIISCSLVFMIILLALVKESYYKELLNLGVASIIASVLTFVISKIMLNNLATLFKSSTNINMNKLNMNGGILIIVGIFSIVLYFVIKKSTACKSA